MQGSGEKRADGSDGVDADAVFGDFMVPEDADVESGEAAGDDDEPGEERS